MSESPMSPKSPVSPASPSSGGCRWDWPLQADDGIVKVHNDDDKFEVHLDAPHFIPNDIQVRVVGRHVDVHAEHKSKSGPIGDVARKLSRSYTLPDDVNECAVKSWLSPRGYLVITAAKKPHISYPERLILHDYS